MFFVASPNYPEDIPVREKEYAFQVIGQSNRGRAVVVAYEFTGKAVSYRAIFQRSWRTEWSSTGLNDMPIKKIQKYASQWSLTYEQAEKLYQMGLVST